MRFTLKSGISQRATFSLYSKLNFSTLRCFADVGFQRGVSFDYQTNRRDWQVVWIGIDGLEPIFVVCARSWFLWDFGHVKAISWGLAGEGLGCERKQLEEHPKENMLKESFGCISKQSRYSRYKRNLNMNWLHSIPSWNQFSLLGSHSHFPSYRLDCRWAIFAEFKSSPSLHKRLQLATLVKTCHRLHTRCNT